MNREQASRQQTAWRPQSGDRIRWGVQLTIILAVLWLALNGLDGWLVGTAACLIGGGLGAWLVPARPYPWRPHRLATFFGYFLRESLVGGLDVAWRALHPALPIEPHWVEHRLRLPSGQPRTLMISVVSLLPGTLSAELTGDNTLVIHSIAPRPDSTIKGLEQRIVWLFSLEDAP